MSRVAGGDQHVVRARLAGVGDVGPGRVGLGGGVRVVDDDRLLVAVVHLPPHLELLHRVEPVEGRRALGVHHRDEPSGRSRPAGPGDDAAGLVGVVGAGVGDDLVVERRRIDSIATEPTPMAPLRAWTKALLDDAEPVVDLERGRARVERIQLVPLVLELLGHPEPDPEGEPDVVQRPQPGLGLRPGTASPGRRPRAGVQHGLRDLPLGRAQGLLGVAGGTPRPRPGRRGRRRAAAGPAPGRAGPGAAG